MAQTKKRRKRKHRGTPAGTIETRGRTGRPQVRKDARAISRDRRAERIAQPPTWRGALNRSAIAAAIFVVAVVAIFGQSIASSVLLGAIMVFLYWPMTYYLDSFMYRRRQRRGGDGGAEGRRGEG